MKKIISLFAISVAFMFTGCVTPSSVGAGEEAVLVKKPYFFGHGVSTLNQLKLG